jgi:N-methylhydantoinase A
MATVTDADLVLGRIDGDNYSGGKIRLNSKLARTAVETALASALKLETEPLALGIAEMVEENMAGAARVHAIESGKQLTDRVLVAFGGAAPLHAARLAEKLDMSRVIIPRHAGVGSAVGFLRAPVAYEIARSFYQRLDTLNVDLINPLLANMQQEALDVVLQGAPGSSPSETRDAFMRYVGQGHEIAVKIPLRALQTADIGLIRSQFEATYKLLYRRVIPDAAIEILSWIVRVSAPAPATRTGTDGVQGVSAASADSERLVFDHRAQDFVATKTFPRAALMAGARVAGPAIIVEDETATLVTEAFDAIIQRDGAILLERRHARTQSSS